MRIVRFDGTGGASGDMILGAFAALGVDMDALYREVAATIPEHFHWHAAPAVSHGISGIRFKVECHEHEHHHHEGHSHRHGRTWREIRALIENAPLPAPARERALAVFQTLAEAEAAVHGVVTDDVHFHEVGATDSLVDILGCCLAFDALQIDAVDVGTLSTGQGSFRCAHGVMPIPAPATAELIRRCRLTVAPGGEAFELLTPTGAALLGVWPRRPLPPAARIAAIGNAFGQRELDHTPNWLRATLYESVETPAAIPAEVIELICNLDDITGEIVGDTMDRLFAAGALDVWTVAIGMKKSRPGIALHVLAQPEMCDALREILFRHTTTFGVRTCAMRRDALERRMENVTTPYGDIRVKVGSCNGAVLSRHPEYADCRQCADAAGVPVKEVIAAARREIEKD